MQTDLRQHVRQLVRLDGIDDCTQEVCVTPTVGSGEVFEKTWSHQRLLHKKEGAPVGRHGLKKRICQCLAEILTH